ncbi:hypothetical protein MJO55_28470 (plasmid) [Mycolicibacterium rufum]|uniref:Uncharacterized protein n=1 Tax=Mycolicibacterium rufum TaxID=318424 RepID=A0A9X2YID3_9MYCO|nr:MULTISPECIES: hypothetical protein [Mycobacteriaceae]MCG7594890.1 hypothetical protein [Mycobacterium sp. PSTR-4-N]MCV7074313.1 hypothetical protein [Mycolicibacterium rufum]ULP39863.1 hypothetical protein MJO55_28470 [Mycolicibacterium rufum]
MIKGIPRWCCRRPPQAGRWPARAALVVVVAATLLGLASTGAPSVAAEPSSAQTSSIAPPRPGVPTPAKHSYDDTHPGQQPDGASPALWILVGAVAGLVAIAVIMLRAGKPVRHHLTRGP